MPFIDLVDAVVEQYPEILPPTIDVVELRKDIALAKQLAPIIVANDAFSEDLRRTYTATFSDAMGTSFDVYNLVKINRDKIQGMNAIADEMASYFKNPLERAPMQRKQLHPLNKPISNSHVPEPG